MATANPVSVPLSTPFGTAKFAMKPTRYRNVAKKIR
jgi:hypothetical protein